MRTRILKRTFANGDIRWVVQYRFTDCSPWHEEASYRWRWRARFRKWLNDMQAAEWTVVDEQVDEREGGEG